MVMGDLNAILSQADKVGGRVFVTTSSDPFFNFVHSNGLVDLGFVGNPYTWSNKRQGLANIKERLDRSFANQEWIHLFPEAKVCHLPAITSDHNPILISSNGTASHLPKPFKFEAFWVRDPSCFQIIATSWFPSIVGSAAFALTKKWAATKGALKVWNLTQYGNIQCAIKKIGAEIDVLQQSTPSQENIDLEISLQSKLQEQFLREETLWQQKSRELWLTCKELNTKFFHASTVNRRRFNSVSLLKNNDGAWLKNRSDIGDYFCSYFANCFTTSNPSLDMELDSLFPPCISDDDNSLLCAIPEELEIYHAVSHLGRTKAPGPDGMTGLFYTTYWQIVRTDVILFVQSFFRGGYMLQEINHTNLVLIPKTDNPSRANQFRPISLANFNIRLFPRY
ncbi:hypothetical protein SLA2020_276710 [Shorea laevis]